MGDLGGVEKINLDFFTILQYILQCKGASEMSEVNLGGVFFTLLTMIAIVVPLFYLFKELGRDYNEPKKA